MTPRALAMAAIAAITLSGCAGAPTEVAVTGTVTDQTKAVAIPAIGTTALVVRTPAPLGSHVSVGQTLVQLDDTILTARLRQARSAVDVADAQVGQIHSAIDKTYSADSKLASARIAISRAIDQLSAKASQLADSQRQLLTARNGLSSQLIRVQAALRTPGLPPSEIARLQQLARTLQAQLAKIDSTLAMIEKTAPRLTLGLKTARSNQAKLQSASTNISDARAQLRRLAKLAKIVADAAPIGVELATVQRNQATVTAPMTGTVVDMALPGDRLAPGATVAAIRPDDPTQVTAWLAPDQLAMVCVGDQARLHGDWMAPGTSVPARLSWISPTADFPPSNTATKETHLMRATKVALTSDSQLPAGIGIDITITGCQSVAGQGKQDR